MKKHPVNVSISMRRIKFVVCAAILTFGVTMSSCTRVKNKVISMIRSIEDDLSECNISSLYPQLSDDDCIGFMDNGFFYNYWFRYKATPSDVEAAILSKECSFVDIKPDTTLVPCTSEFILSEMKMLSEEAYPEFVEWRWVENPDKLLFFKCTRTPLQHLLVFDTSTGYVYHYINEFRE